MENYRTAQVGGNFSPLRPGCRLLCVPSIIGTFRLLQCGGGEDRREEQGRRWIYDSNVEDQWLASPSAVLAGRLTRRRCNFHPYPRPAPPTPFPLPCQGRGGSANLATCYPFPLSHGNVPRVLSKVLWSGLGYPALKWRLWTRQDFYTCLTRLLSNLFMPLLGIRNRVIVLGLLQV